jgi:hypothetical protein
MKTRRAALMAGVLAIAGIAVVLTYMYGRRPNTKTPSHSATLRWQPSVGATSYNVYRSTTEGAQGQKIGTSNLSTYIDRPIPGRITFYYTVTAVANGRESGPSNEAEAVVP